MSDQTQSELEIPDFKGLKVKDARNKCPNGLTLEVTNPSAAGPAGVEESEIKENAPSSPPHTTIVSPGIASVVIHSLS